MIPSPTTQDRELIPILMADDDEDDVFLTEEALSEARVANPFSSVGDGVELLDYLLHRNGFDEENAPRPGLILLDLNMPRMSGLEALGRLKAIDETRAIPVVVLTTSDAEEDVFRTYDLGASSFISKPVTIEGLVSVVRAFSQYWLQIVKVPRERDSS